MKIQVTSDIHTEFQADHGRSCMRTIAMSEADTLVIAGDLSSGKGIEKALDFFVSKYNHVVYVTGNHEYYGSDRDSIHDMLQKLSDKHSNLHWLNNKVVELDGKRFVGTTLWYPDLPDARKYKHWLTDFKTIKNLEDWIWTAFEESTLFLKNNLRDGDIVVTHHMPFEDSISKRYKGEISNCFFLGDVTETLLRINESPAYWIHGHTHDAFNYIWSLPEQDKFLEYEGMERKECKINVLCNPHGYPEEMRPFNYDLIIDV